MDLNQFPIRCYTCGKFIGNHAPVYFEHVQKGKSPEDVLNDLHILRYCCRMLFMTYVPVPTGFVPSTQPIDPSIVPLPAPTVERTVTEEEQRRIERRSQFSSHGYIVPIGRKKFLAR